MAWHKETHNCIHGKLHPQKLVRNGFEKRINPLPLRGAIIPFRIAILNLIDPSERLTVPEDVPLRELRLFNWFSRMQPVQVKKTKLTGSQLLV